MKTTLVDDRFFVAESLAVFFFFGNLLILQREGWFSDRTRFRRYKLYIGRNPPRDVPHKEIPWWRLLEE
jgi:hypothetical protein